VVGGQDGPQAVEVRLGEAVQVDGGPAHAAVPPQGHAVALDQLQEALQDGLFEGVAGGVAVGPARR
jgi:hypothetical protein